MCAKNRYLPNLRHDSKSQNHLDILHLLSGGEEGGGDVERVHLQPGAQLLLLLPQHPHLSHTGFLEQNLSSIGTVSGVGTSVSDPDSFFTDPDPGFLSQSGSGFRIRIQATKN